MVSGSGRVACAVFVLIALCIPNFLLISKALCGPVSVEDDSHYGGGNRNRIPARWSKSKSI